jgi:hypothetical protein
LEQVESSHRLLIQVGGLQPCFQKYLRSGYWRPGLFQQWQIGGWIAGITYPEGKSKGLAQSFPGLKGLEMRLSNKEYRTPNTEV